MGAKKNIWLPLLILFLVALVSAALVSLLVAYFEEIDAFVLPISVAVCLLGVVISLLFVRKRSLRQHKRELCIIGACYALLAATFFLYHFGFVWNILLFFVFIILIVAANVCSTSLYFWEICSSNVVYATTISALLSGLFYASRISADWGTLFLTLLSGWFFAGLGFISSIISFFLIKSKFPIGLEK